MDGNLPIKAHQREIIIHLLNDREVEATLVLESSLLFD